MRTGITAPARIARKSKINRAYPNGTQCRYEHWNTPKLSQEVPSLRPESRRSMLRIFSHGRKSLTCLTGMWRASVEGGRDRIKYLIRIEKFSRYRLLFANSVRRARERDRRQVFGHKRARPPAALTWFRETVAIPICANKFWRRVREWVVGQQPNNSFFVFEQSLHEREEPRVQVRR